MVCTPASGNSTTGSSAVAGRGMASVIHHTAIHTPAATVSRPTGLSEPSTGSSQRQSAASSGPVIRPARATRDGQGLSVETVSGMGMAGGG